MYFRLVTSYRTLIYLNTKQPVGTDGKANLPSVNTGYLYLPGCPSVPMEKFVHRLKNSILVSMQIASLFVNPGSGTN